MYKQNAFNSLQFDLLIGCLLGDASLQTENNRTWKARFIHQAIYEPYIRHKYDILSSYCNTEPEYSLFLNERTQKRHSRFQFNTLASSDFRFLAGMFYIQENGFLVKRVPKNIKKFLTPRALAYWYMDVGSLKWKGHSNAVCLRTDSFSYSDVCLLKSALEENFDLKCSIQRKNGKSRISILEESYLKLRTLILPHLLDYMYYKFPDGKYGVVDDEDIPEEDLKKV